MEALVRGRPRDQVAEHRIIQSALTLMARHGYNRMSMDMVATDAGVTKPTIYRRYKGKEALAVAALVVFCRHDIPPPTGDTRADLIAQMNHFRAGVERPYGMAMIGTVLAEEHDTPTLLALFRAQMIAPRRASLRVILTRAREAGELRPDANTAAAATMLIGAYYAHYLSGEPFPAHWVETTVDAMLRGITK